MSQGWVKFYRKFAGMPVFTDPNLWHLFSGLMLTVNHSPNTIYFPNVSKPINVLPGQTITSYHELAVFLYGQRKSKSKTSLVRRNVERLQKENMITTIATSHYTMISIVDWDTYMSHENKIDTPVTNTRHADDKPMTSPRTAGEQPVTTNKNEENGKKGKNGKNENNFFGSDEPEQSPVEEVKPKRVGKPNPIWDTLVELFKINPVTPRKQKELGRIVADFAAEGATPDEIRTRLQRYKAAYPKIPETPRGLLNQWDTMGRLPDKPPLPKVGEPSIEDIIGRESPEKFERDREKYKDDWAANDPWDFVKGYEEQQQAIQNGSLKPSSLPTERDRERYEQAKRHTLSFPRRPEPVVGGVPRE